MSRLSMTKTVGSKFFRLWKIFVLPTRFRSSPLTTVADPVKLSALRSMIPVTITSSISLTSSSSTTLISVWPVYFTSCDFIPIKEKRSTTSFISGNETVNFPSLSVEMPKAEPFNKTVTPGNGFPFTSFTVPFTVTCFGWGNWFLTGRITTVLSIRRKLYPSPSICFKASSKLAFLHDTDTFRFTFTSRLLKKKSRLVCPFRDSIASSHATFSSSRLIR